MGCERKGLKVEEEGRDEAAWDVLGGRKHARATRRKETLGPADRLEWNKGRNGIFGAWVLEMNFLYMSDFRFEYMRGCFKIHRL